MATANTLCPKCLTYYPEGGNHTCTGSAPDPVAALEAVLRGAPPVTAQEQVTPVVTAVPAREPDPIDLLISKAQFSLRMQTGGNHYQKGTIQPLEFFHDNDIPFAEASVMKYAYRWREKGGTQDLKKAIQLLFQIIAMEERKAARVAAK